MYRSDHLPIICCIVFLALAGCTKEPLKAEKSTWQQVPGITNDSKIILNASTDGKQLFTYGPYNLDIIDSQLRSKTIIHGANSLNIPPASSIFLGYFFEDRQLFFFNSYQAIQHPQHAAALSLYQISSTGKAFNTTNLSKRYPWAIGNQGQVLLSIREQDDSYSIYLISFTISQGSGAVSLPSSIKKITIPPLQNSPTSFYFLQDRFFFFTNESGIRTLYTLDSRGYIIATNTASDGELFANKDALYLVAGNELVTSKDAGITFGEHRFFSQRLDDYYFRIINDKVLVFKPRTGIGVFELTPEGFQVKAIDMAGLEGNHITQLTLFNEKLFVSTLTGLYFKAWRDVFN